MEKGKKLKLSISAKIAAGSLIILLAIGLFWIFSVAFGRKNDLPVLGEPGHIAGSFSFINQDGKLITEKTVQNKVTVVEYFFTSCPSICPLMNSNMKLVYEKFKYTPDFMILSHTVDPERDSVPVLKAYAKRFDADEPAWQFLTGAKDSLYKCAVKDYLLSAGDSASNNFIHTQYVALLDKKRQIRAFYDFTDKESVLKLSSDIQQLLKDDAN
jgi:protein SCO1/2